MNSNDKKPSPPYVSYPTTRSFIKGLGETTFPSRIDKSVMSNYSGSVIYALLPALTWLGLINPQGIPDDKLKKLAKADDDEFKSLLRDIVEDKYTFLFNDGLDLSNASSDQVVEAFKTQDVSGSTVPRCISFFLGIAKDAGITVSPHVKAPTIKRKSGSSKKKQAKTNEVEVDDTPKQNQQMDGMERIPIPFRGYENGAVYLPEGLEGKEAKRAVKVVKFLLEEYYELDDD